MIKHGPVIVRIGNKNHMTKDKTTSGQLIWRLYSKKQSFDKMMKRVDKAVRV
jgi:hypothetical protein